jgi:hypothetical protein
MHGFHWCCTEKATYGVCQWHMIKGIVQRVLGPSLTKDIVWTCGILRHGACIHVATWICQIVQVIIVDVVARSTLTLHL